MSLRLTWIGCAKPSRAIGSTWQRPACHPRRRDAAAAAGALPPAPPPSGGSNPSTAAAAPPGFLQNPAIARRELMRQFFVASRAEEQLQVVAEAGELLDLGTSLQLLCHMAYLSLKGLQPGTPAQKEQVLSAIHVCLAPALPEAKPVHLATALWSYAEVGAQAQWMDGLLQQAAERELAGGHSRIESYNTQELTSLLFAYGRMARQRTPAVLSYGASLAAELQRRWEGLAYVRGSLSSTDFADLTEACARLYGRQAAGREGQKDAPWGSGGDGSCGSGGRVDSGDGSSSTSSSNGGSIAPATGAAAATTTAASSSVSPAAAAAAAGGNGTDPSAPPAAVIALLEGVAGEVRRQLANKHSARSPWTPRDLIRLARAYAALGHRTPRTAQMLDVLSSFCVQRIRSRHLNCLSRPEDLAGLLEAYAQLGHNSVAVPELLGAVGDQVRLGAAQQQEREAEATARLVGQAAGAAGVAASQPAAALTGSSSSSAAAAAAAAAAGAGAGGMPPPVPHPPAAAPASPPAGSEGPLELSLPQISSLVRSHLRLGYQPPVALLQCLGPQIRRQLPACPAEEAATLLHLLAAAQCSPGPAVVGLLLGRVRDGDGSSSGGSGLYSREDSREGSSASGSSASGSSGMVQAAQRAAEALLASPGGAAAGGRGA